MSIELELSLLKELKALQQYKKDQIIILMGMKHLAGPEHEEYLSTIKEQLDYFIGDIEEFIKRANTQLLMMQNNR